MTALAAILAAHRLWLHDDPTGKRADLVGADLVGADLARADLTRANLTRANLTRANLTEANLTRANLTDANLTDADLSGADLTGANLTGAYLTRAYLTGADLGGANLTESAGVRWAQAGPVGHGRRTLTGVVQAGWGHTEPALIVHGGCAHHTPDWYREAMASGVRMWGWPENTAVNDRWRAEILAAVDWIETSIGTTP